MATACCELAERSPSTNASPDSAIEHTSPTLPPSLAISPTNSTSGTRHSMATTKQSNTRVKQRLRPSERMPSESDEEQFVCEYDKNVTALFKLLEASDWEAAVERCRTHPVEVRTWVTRHDKKVPIRVRWKLLPLHSAVIFSAPISVISAIFEQYPEATTQADDQGMTPLHLAFRHYQEENDSILSFLLDANPQTITAKDYRGRSPIDLALKRQNTRYSAKIMSQYANTCIEVTLFAQEAINIAMMEMTLKDDNDKIHNDGDSESSSNDDRPGDERAELEKDEIALLSKDECVVVTQEKYNSNEYVQFEPQGFEEDEIAQLEREAREMKDVVVLVEKEERDGAVYLERDTVAADVETEKGNDNDGSVEIEACDSASVSCAKEEDDIDITPHEQHTTTYNQGHKQETDSKQKSEHLHEIESLHAFYEERMKAMTDETIVRLRKLHEETATANRELKEQHRRDIQKIKLLVEQRDLEQSGESRELNRSSEDERRTDACCDNEQSDLHRDISTLQTLVENQHKEVETSQAIRALMLKSLWQQDEEDATTRKMEAHGISVLINRIQARLEPLPPSKNNSNIAIESEKDSINEDSSGDGHCDDVSSITEHSHLPPS